MDQTKFEIALEILELKLGTALELALVTGICNESDFPELSNN